jgi:hypothetical protein
VLRWVFPAFYSAVQEKARELMHLFGPFLTVAHFDSGVVSVLKQMGDTNAQQALDVSFLHTHYSHSADGLALWVSS